MSTERPLRTLRLEICYDGTRYSGWQAQNAQPGVRTIQEEVEAAVERVTGDRPSLLGCGRTDAGVSALCQTATFRSKTTIPTENLVPALNAQLPPEIRILAVRDVPADFHPIADILRKRYRYLLSDARPVNPFLKDHVWFVRGRLDRDRMRDAAAYLVGEYDFASFQTTGSPRESTVRTVYEITLTEEPFPTFWTPVHSDRSVTLPPSPTILSVEVEANGFLYNMVRAIVGTLVRFGQRHAGFEEPERMAAIRDARDRALAGPTAPPHALLMVGATYRTSKE